MPESLIADAGTSCTQCKDFKTTLVNFQQKYGGNGMEVYASHIKRVLAQRLAGSYQCQLPRLVWHTR